VIDMSYFCYWAVDLVGNDEHSRSQSEVILILRSIWNHFIKKNSKETHLLVILLLVCYMNLMKENE